MASFDFEKALLIYLGGEPESESILIGLGAARLEWTYGADAPAIQGELDRFLNAANQYVASGYTPTGQNIQEWLIMELPNASSICRAKIKAYLLYHILH